MGIQGIHLPHRSIYRVFCQRFQQIHWLHARLQLALFRTLRSVQCEVFTCRAFIVRAVCRVASIFAKIFLAQPCCRATRNSKVRECSSRSRFYSQVHLLARY